MSTSVNKRRTVVPRRRSTTAPIEPVAEMSVEAAEDQLDSHSVPVLLRLPNLTGQLLNASKAGTTSNAATADLTEPQLSTSEAESTTADSESTSVSEGLHSDLPTAPEDVQHHDESELAEEQAKETADVAPMNLQLFDWKPFEQWLGSSQGKLVAIGLLLAASFAVIAFTSGPSDTKSDTTASKSDEPNDVEITDAVTGMPEGIAGSDAVKIPVEQSFDVPSMQPSGMQPVGKDASFASHEQAIGPPPSDRLEGTRVADQRGGGFSGSSQPVPAEYNRGVQDQFNGRGGVNVPTFTPGKAQRQPLEVGVPAAPNNVIGPPKDETPLYNTGGVHSAGVSVPGAIR